MKKMIILCVIMVSLFIYTNKLNAAGEISVSPGSILEPKISLDFQDARLKDLLKVFSIQSGLNFIASEALQDRLVTLYLDNVPMQQAMDQIFKANNLTYELNKEDNIFIVKDWGKSGVDTITKVFYLKHASVSTSSIKEEQSNNKDASTSSSSSSGSGGSGSSGGSTSSGGKWKAETDSGITYSVKKLLSNAGSVIEDFRTNSLIVTDAPNRIKVISEVIAALDIRVPQIMLEVEMIDVNKNAIDKLGVQYNDLTTSFFTAVIKGAAIGTGFPVPNNLVKGFIGTAVPGMVTPGSVTFGTSNVAFDFIKQNVDAKVLARPKIMTLNNETAEIRITTDEVIGLITTQEGTGDSAANRTTTAERSETGVTLRVTPQINEDTGEITMFIFPSVRDATTASGFAAYKNPEERSTKSIVRIMDGDTVVIGGLIRHDRSQTDTKLPILGDIPFVGGAFRHKSKDRDKERELLVFITPRIIVDKQAKSPEVKRLILPLREQNAAPGLNRSYMVNSAMNSFEKKGK